MTGSSKGCSILCFLGAESLRMHADRRDLPLCCAAAGSARFYTVLPKPRPPPFFYFASGRTAARFAAETALALRPGHAATVCDCSFGNGLNSIATANAARPITNDPMYSHP